MPSHHDRMPRTRKSGVSLVLRGDGPRSTSAFCSRRLQHGWHCQAVTGPDRQVSNIIQTQQVRWLCLGGVTCASSFSKSLSKSISSSVSELQVRPAGTINGNSLAWACMPCDATKSATSNVPHPVVSASCIRNFVRRTKPDTRSTIFCLVKGS